MFEPLIQPGLLDKENEREPSNSMEAVKVVKISQKDEENQLYGTTD